MIEIMVDGKTVEEDFTELETVSEVIRKIAKELEEGQSVVKVHLDGEDVTGKFDLQEDAVSDFQRLEVNTGGTTEVAIDALDGLTEFHSAFLQELSRVSDEYRLGDEEKAHQLFARCLDGLQVLMKTTMTAANLLQIETSEIQSGDSNMEQTIAQIGNLLDEMIEAQIQRDSILLADLLEYELIPYIEDWGGYLRFLQHS